MDHRGPDFGQLGLRMLANLKQVFRTAEPVVIYPASGTGAWEAALANTLSPGDRVLMCRTGWFATLWQEMAVRLGLEPVFIDTDWRRGADVAAIGEALADGQRAPHQGGVRGAQRDLDGLHQPHRRGAGGDRRGRPSGAADGGHHLLAGQHRLPARRMGRRRHRGGFAEGADAAARAVLQRHQRQGAGGGGTARNCRAATGTGGRCWRPTPPAISRTRPATNLLYGLDAALEMLLEEGLENVFARHARHAEATRRAVRGLGAGDPVRRSAALLRPR